MYRVDDIENYLKISEIKYIILNKNAYLFDNPSDYIYANEYSLIFIKDKKNENFNLLLRKTKAKIVICSLSIDIMKNLLNDLNKCLIQVENPQLIFSKIAYKFFKEKDDYNIHKTSIIHPEAKIEKNVYIGPFCYIGKCKVKKNTMIGGKVYIYDETEIGENCLIQAGVVLGNDGFGHIKEKDGKWQHFPHFGKVIIENDVHIGSNTTIAKGSLSNTIIKSGAKINSLVSIAHNVFIGENCFIGSSVNINGSAKICDNVYIAPQSTIRDNVTIGQGAFIGLGAVVTKNIPEEEVWVGNPAKKHVKGENCEKRKV